jgi:hypothetical protein
MRYWAVLSASIVLSILGIIWGVLSANPANGARGGALAVMISLVALFISREYGAKVYDIIAHQMQEIGRSADSPRETSIEENIEALKNQLTAMGEQSRLNGQEQSKQNFVLAVATAIGTFVWGFGDMITTFVLWSKPVVVRWLCMRL